MKSSEGRKEARDDKRTRSQLQQELAEAQATIKKQENELVAYQDELKQAHVKLGSLEELQANLDSAKEQLEKRQKVEQENQELKKRAQAAEERASTQVEEAKTELRASEEQRRQLEKRIQGLGTTVDTLREKLTAAEQARGAVSEDIPSPKSSYRIDLYPHQGHYRGRIEHLLTKDKKAFTGLDQSTIVEFISRHLPKIEETAEEAKPTPIPTVARAEMPPSKEVPGPIKIPAKVPRVHDLRIVPAKGDVSSIVLRHGQPFEVRITLDLTDVVSSTKAPVEHTVTIYAKPLPAGHRQTVGETHGVLSAAEEATVETIKTIATPLPAGAYRLEAAVTFSRPTGTTEPVPPGSFLEGSLFHVS